MNIHFTLPPEAIGTVKGATKTVILEALADRFASVYQLDRDRVLEAIQAREALGSTGFGRGVAIPHARIEGLRRPAAVLLRLASPVDFDAADGVPVGVVCGLLSPENSGAAHLHALAAVSRLMRDERVHRALADAQSDEAIYGLLTNASDRDAA